MYMYMHHSFGISQTDNHGGSPCRITISIKNFLSKAGNIKQLKQAAINWQSISEIQVIIYKGKMKKENQSDDK